MIAARLDRAESNMLESLPIFLGLALLALLRGRGDGLATAGGLVFLIARIAYVPAYVSGLPWLRSLIWLAGNAGLLLIAVAILRAQG